MSYSKYDPTGFGFALSFNRATPCPDDETIDRALETKKRVVMAMKGTVGYWQAVLGYGPDLTWRHGVVVYVDEKIIDETKTKLAKHEFSTPVYVLKRPDLVYHTSNADRRFNHR